jgi:hypothetical protein
MNPLILPLTFGKDGSFKIAWNKRLFFAVGAIILPHKLTSTDDVENTVTNAQLVFKLTEFKSSLRNKILGTLGGVEQTALKMQTPPTEILGLVTRVNIQTGTVLAIEDARTVTGDGAEGHGNFLDESAKVLHLSASDEDELKSALNQSFTPQILDVLRQPFVAFHPELSDSWKNRDNGSMEEGSLVPFQMVFPQLEPIQRTVDGETFFIDDLYCTNLQCNCKDITCVIIKTLPESRTQVAWGGFRWNTETDKFKALPQFHNKFNPSEWFKKFNAASGFDLKMLLIQRMKFMRTEVAPARLKRG